MQLLLTIANTLTKLIAFGLAILLVGFVLFLGATGPQSIPAGRKADGIVALTGGKARIGEAVKLLSRKRAKRLLITGVHPETTSRQLRKLVHGSSELFECCIDLGREARDTRGNAVETRDWARKHNYTSLIVVTSSYHMPRSLVELRRLLPDVELLPHAVVPQSFRASGWWADQRVMRLILSEYLKYLPALALLCFSRVTGGAGA
ncbi:MAG: YdcF family protein [Alphaproteobacteria bacterium]|nr:MAG: YdcF family protein [Alphaproteobacteria bacterium]